MNYGQGENLILKYFKTFGSECYILNDGENLNKFDSKSYLGIFQVIPPRTKPIGYITRILRLPRNPIIWSLMTQEKPR